MNDNRSPLGGEKLTFIGIFTVTMITVIFILLINIGYSDVEAASANSTEANTKNSITSTNPVENSTEKEYVYIDNYVGEERARIAHKPVIFEEFTGVPENVQLEIESKLSSLEMVEEDDDSIVDSNDIINDTPFQATRSKNKKAIFTPATVIKHKAIFTKAEVEEPTTEATTEEPQPEMTYYGCLELTAYTWTGNPCADGVYPSSGYTVACNNSDLWHRWIYIEGYGTYYVHDTGGMGYGVIDVYMDSYDACIQFGRRSANIYIIN